MHQAGAIVMKTQHQQQTTEYFATTVIRRVQAEFEAFCSYPDSYIPPLDDSHKQRLSLCLSGTTAALGGSRGKKSVDTRVIQLGEQILQDNGLGAEILCLVLFNSKTILVTADTPSLLKALRTWNTDRQMPASLVQASRKWITIKASPVQANAMNESSTGSSPVFTLQDKVQSAMLCGPDETSQSCWGKYDSIFSPLNNLPHEVCKAWLESGGLPKVFPSEILHPKGEIFTDLGLSKKFWSASPAKIGVHDGGMVVEAPNKKELIGLMTYWSGRQEPHDINFNLTLGLDQSEGFHPPMLEGEPIPELVDDTCEVFWVLRGGHTEPHIGIVLAETVHDACKLTIKADHGLKVISCPIGQRKSIFYMWPATAENLRILDHSYVAGQSFGSLCDRLKHGIREVVSGRKALLMPTGTIHGVSTLSDGFIVTQGHIDSSSLIPMSRWLANSPNFLNRLSRDNRHEFLELFIDACLQCPEHAVESVKVARKAIKTLTHELPKTITRLSKRMEDPRCVELQTAFEDMKDLMFKDRPGSVLRMEQSNNRKRKARKM